MRAAPLSRAIFEALFQHFPTRGPVPLLDRIGLDWTGLAWLGLAAANSIRSDRVDPNDPIMNDVFHRVRG